MTLKINSEATMNGSNAERLALDLISLKTGFVFDENDTGNSFTVYGDTWKQTKSGGISRTAETAPIASSYTGDQSIGATATPFTFATGTTGVRIKVTHATQSIRVGMGASSAEADTNAALSTPYIIGDGIQIEGRGALITHFSLLGSGAATTVNVTQVV